jgi:hypothetical protein
MKIALKRPSDEFLKLCRLHVEIFTTFFNAKPESANIREAIVSQIINITNVHHPEWFSETDICYHHRLQVTNFLVIILLWKNCKWSVDRKKNILQKPHTKNQKLLNLMHA